MTRMTVVGGGLLLMGGWGWWRFRRWLADHTRRASADSAISQTRLGPVEYDRRGHGPVVLHAHGGNVGHNGWFVLEHLPDVALTRTQTIMGGASHCDFRYQMRQADDRPAPENTDG
jgi:hypothetical protein